MMPANLEDTWPPSFTLDQERILNLLTGDRFYSNPSAALREAVLNAIDAVQRRRGVVRAHPPEITMTFNRDNLTLTVTDNGVGMSRVDIIMLFTKVGASAATAEAKKESVGEFGIGVISYFMAADTFTLQTNDGENRPIGLSFSKEMLAGAGAAELSPTQESQGSTVTIQIRDPDTFDLLLDSFPHWCRDVEGLSARVLPDNRSLGQGGSHRADNTVEVEQPQWVERAHLAPVADPTGWDAMTGVSTVAVLYRGVFVQEFEVKKAWGIEGSIDVDPKHFKPRLNREGFVEGQFQEEVESFLQECHPTILVAMASRLAAAVEEGALDKWTEKRWASLWLSVPRDGPYTSAVEAWDAVFRSLPAFERAVGNKWEGISLDQLKIIGGEIFLAPLAEEKSNDVVRAALHFLRTTGHTVIRGIRKDGSWMRFAPSTFGTTADLISTVFANELPPLTPITPRAEQILAEITRIAPLYTGPPPVDLVRIGKDSPPVLRLSSRLIINTDHPAGEAIAKDALRENDGPMSLITITARHAYQQLTEVAAAVREIAAEPEVLSPIRRRYIRSHLP
jgi:hypothetical protein